MSFAEKLRVRRKEKGVSQEQLAEILGVSRQAISKWELGIGLPDYKLQYCCKIECRGLFNRPYVVE